jgi:hypothetical protein
MLRSLARQSLLRQHCVASEFYFSKKVEDYLIRFKNDIGTVHYITGYIHNTGTTLQ